MSMRSQLLFPAFLLAVALGALTQTPGALAQTPPPPKPAGQTDQTGQQPQKSTDPVPQVDPLVQRDKELRKFDPLAKPEIDPQADPRVPQGTEKNPISQFGGATDDVTITGPRSGADLTKEYNGPAVLTRSYGLDRSAVPENIRFRPSAGVSEIYDNGLIGIASRTDGTGGTNPAFGTMVRFGFEGRHYWVHDILTISYAGNFSRYTPASAYDGSNHSFNLDWTHALSKRLRLSLLSTASHYSLNYSLENTLLNPDVSIANVNLATTPNTQIFDNSTTQASNSVHLTWQESARLSFDISGSYFFVKRAGVGLIGSEGAQAGADVTYRFSKKITSGVYYAHTYYRFSHAAGDTDSNAVGLIYSYAFDPRTELRTRVGINVLQNLGITSVSIDPAIAALLGQSAGYIQFYSVNRLLDFSGSLTRQLKGGRNVHAAYSQGTTPGNGVFVASKQQTVDLGYSMQFRRKDRIDIGGGRSALSSVSQVIGQYTSENFHVGVTKPIQKSLSADFAFDYRHFEITSSPLLRNQYRVTVGISWSNEDFPSRIF